MSDAPHPRLLGRSIVAILAGFGVVVVLSLGTDAILHAAKVFPPFGQPPGDKPLLLATAYRTLYAILGSYLVARLAPYQPMNHALISGIVGLVLSIAGAVATWNAGPAYGPHWYPLALMATCLPCAWIGGKLYTRRSR